MGDILTGDNTGHRWEQHPWQGDDTRARLRSAALRQLQEGCGLDRAELARRLSYSRSQLYQILDGGIRRPPEWDRLVEPLVRACTGNDERAVAAWRRRHGVLVEVYSELRRRTQQDSTPELSPRPMRVVPAQLPADVDVFTGRAAELAELDLLLAADRSDGRTSTAVVISAVSGTAGVGKTALALRWAHRLRRDFPDGQLYVNLRGYDPDQPLSAGDALAGFLRALGLAGQDIPLEVDERAAAYRSLLDGRRMLVVLDNAATVEQIRPLIPGVGSCLVLVTSRDSLAGLVARHGARRLDLDLLPLEDAVALLRALIGERVEIEPDAAVTLARQCARLPLALRVAAELAAVRPASSLTALVGELVDAQRRLDLLDAGGDPRTAVHVVFSWSYQHLPADAARTFRLLGLHPGPDFDPHAAAALVDSDQAHAHHLLDMLAQAHLVQPAITGRYGMHDLLRAYAIRLSTAEDTDQERRAALTHLFDHYLATSAVAVDTLYPAEQHRRPRIPTPTTTCPPVADLTAARGWLDAERTTLTVTCVHTATHGWPGHSIRLATTLFRYLEVGGHYLDALTVQTNALHAARREDDRAAEACTLANLGVVYFRQGHYGQALDDLQQALILCREIGDRVNEAHTLDNLGDVYWRRGRYEQAIDHHQQALALFREIGYRVGEADALDSLGVIYWRRGHYQQAAEHHQQALVLSREIGDPGGEAKALNGLGETRQVAGELGEACTQHTAALALATEIGDRYEQARAHNGLARTYQANGDLDQARQHWREAFTLYTDLGVPEADDVRVQSAALDHGAADDSVG